MASISLCWTVRTIRRGLVRQNVYFIGTLPWTGLKLLMTLTKRYWTDIIFYIFCIYFYYRPPSICGWICYVFYYDKTPL
jgi:hypothetical protein